MDNTVARIEANLKKVKDSGMTFVEYVRLKKQELEDAADELADLEKLASVFDDLALTTPSGRARRKDAGKPREKKTDDQPQPPPDAIPNGDEPPLDSPTE
jgi:hypothetical protein